jgi:hypothetical protein
VLGGHGEGQSREGQQQVSSLVAQGSRASGSLAVLQARAAGAAGRELLRGSNQNYRQVHLQSCPLGGK